MKNKQKVRTCGNCINCVKVNPTRMCYSTYKCDCPFNDTYFLGRTKPSYLVECKYHEFKNENYENKPMSESTKNIIDGLYGTEVDNKLLTFLENNE